MCHYYESFYHNAPNFPYHDYVDTRCASLGKTLNEMTDKIVEIIKEIIATYSHYFNHNRNDYNEPDSSIESLKLEVSLFDDFDHLIWRDLIYMMICLSLPITRE